MSSSRDFDDLVAEAAAAPIDGWDFGWLDGRALEERPSWRYFDLVSERAPTVDSLLELEVGTGAMLGALPTLPARAVGTEGFAPNVPGASRRLRANGASLVQTSRTRAALPFACEVFDLVVSRHPIAPRWDEIVRVLRPGATYLAQHVGPHSLRTLAERFVAPWPPDSERDPERERSAAERAGLDVVDLRLERLRTVFYDIGAVVWFLRLVVWIVPGFTVDGHRDELRSLHAQIVRDGSFETTASRVLIEAIKAESPRVGEGRRHPP